VESRARFLLEVTEAVVGAWQPGRVGVRLSPTGAFGDMSDSDPAATFSHAARELNRFGLSFLHLMEALPGHPMASPGPRIAPLLRQAFRGPVILNGGYDAALGDQAIAEGEGDLVAYGVPFLANPDLVERFRIGAPLNPPDYSTLYSGGAQGYTDYPALTATP
jgi:N-ethylmaleimide reductase